VVLAVVRKSREGPLFSCFTAFLRPQFLKSFEGVHEVPPPSMCTYGYGMLKLIFLEDKKNTEKEADLCCLVIKIIIIFYKQILKNMSFL
jgi:hypothetical protein